MMGTTESLDLVMIMVEVTTFTFQMMSIIINDGTIKDSVGVAAKDSSVMHQTQAPVKNVPLGSTMTKVSRLKRQASSLFQQI